ncbi:MAG: ABC transporter ATP-binding protein [Natronomonas sp.]
MSESQPPALAVDGLRKEFDGVTAVDGVSLEIGRSEFFGLVGPSGCGKTTTLRMLAGLTEPDDGVVRIDGTDATAQPARRRDTNMVFQDLILFPHMTVAENVGYGLARDGVDGPERTRRVEEALELVSLPGFGDRDPTELSGGQKQRVALARALVNDPAVLLLDEPLSSLDRSLREEMESELKRIQRESETAFLYVTHDQESAMSMSDRICVMHSGGIADVGPPERLYERPKTRFVADFLGDATMLRGEVTERTRDGAVVETQIGTIEARSGRGDGSAPVGSTATVVVRPEAVTVGTGRFAGTVLDTAYKGFYEQAQIELDTGDRLVARTAPGTTDPAATADGGTRREETTNGRSVIPEERIALDIDRAVIVTDGND